MAEEKITEIIKQRHKFISNESDELKKNQELRETKAKLLDDIFKEDMLDLKQKMHEIELLYDKINSKSKYIKNEFKQIISKQELIKLENRIERLKYEEYINREEFEKLINKKLSFS